MTCKKIQELLLTDYADGETNAGQNEMIRKHIVSCRVCKELEAKIQADIIRPFQKTRRMEPPAHLWYRVKTTIESNQKPPLPALIFEKIKKSFQIQKPVYAFSTAAIMLFIAIIVTASPHYFYKIRNQQLANKSLEDQINYLTRSNGYADNGEITALGTGIEEYFL